VGLGRPLLAALPIFILHVIEEAPGFVAWFNAHVPRGINQDMFWMVNLVAFSITVAVIAAEWLAPSTVTAMIVVAWFGFLMAANAILHIVGAIADHGYVPGLVSATALYLPFHGWVAHAVVRARRLSALYVAVITLVAAVPMLAHGYLIIFRQSRLF
jgi:hypothetical protein